jgi:tetratricopeptide (TPR) repeat protein
MIQKLAQEAISVALEQDWKKAIEINKKILAINPDDIDALNRMAKANFELGNIKRARILTERVLYIDSLNSIAIKCFEKYEVYEGKNTKPETGKAYFDQRAASEIFIEEPGKTRLISLIQLGSEEVTLSLNSGQPVQMVASKHKISICTEQGVYIGKLADDMAKRLIELLRDGNKYAVYVKSASRSCVKIFIKEVDRKNPRAGSPSFPVERL